jgi:predicted RNase H-like HicB family nuclease
MEAKDWVLKRFPGAYAELNDDFWWIRCPERANFLAKGKTEKSAWMRAKKKIILLLDFR